MSDKDLPSEDPGSTPPADQPAAESSGPATGLDQPVEPAGLSEQPDDQAAPGMDDSGGSQAEESPGGRTRRRRAVAIAAAVLLAGAGAAVAVATRGGSCPSGDAVVEAEGATVTEDDLVRRAELVEALYGLTPPEGDKADDYRRELAKSMATALIVEREAQRRDVVVADRAVRDALDRYVADFFPEGGRTRFVEAMGDKGVSEAEVLAEFRQIQTTFRLLERAAGKVTVTDKEVAAAYDARAATLAVPEQRRIRHLVVASQAEADAARARLARGEAFADVTKAVSLDGSTKDQGGDLGLRGAADLDEAFRQQAFATAQGAVFGPVQTRLGWHVGVVDEIVPGRPLSREEAAAPLREQLVTERTLAAQRSYVAELLAGADVCYDDRFRPADPDAPPPRLPGSTPDEPTPPADSPPTTGG